MRAASKGRASRPLLRGQFFCLPSPFFYLPTACAVGCILTPLRGWWWVSLLTRR